MESSYVEKSILQTLRYASLFQAGISIARCYKFLQTSIFIPKHEFYTQLYELVKKGVIVKKGKYVSVEKEYLEYAQEREKNAYQKEAYISSIRFLFSWIPWIFAVGITGSVAALNAQDEDDIDLIILCQKERLWICRAVLAPLLFVLGVLRTSSSVTLKNKLCLNLWIDEARYSLLEKNIYIAYEISQIRWVFTRGQEHLCFLKKNAWIGEYLVHCLASIRLKTFARQKELPHISRIITAANKFAYHVQCTYMRAHKTREKVSLHEAFFHPKNVQNQVLSKLNSTQNSASRYNTKVCSEEETYAHLSSLSQTARILFLARTTRGYSTR